MFSDYPEDTITFKPILLRSKEWDEVDETCEPTKVECKHCGNKISRKIERIRKHLGKCPVRNDSEKMDADSGSFEHQNEITNDTEHIIKHEVSQFEDEELDIIDIDISPVKKIKTLNSNVWMEYDKTEIRTKVACIHCGKKVSKKLERVRLHLGKCVKRKENFDLLSESTNDIDPSKPIDVVSMDFDSAYESKPSSHQILPDYNEFGLIPLLGVRARAKEWEEVEESGEPTKVICNHCKEKVSRKIERIRRHLRMCPKRLKFNDVDNTDLENNSNSNYANSSDTKTPPTKPAIKLEIEKIDVQVPGENRRRAFEWAEFNNTTERTKVECKHCGKKVSKKIERVRKHLGKCKKIHGTNSTYTDSEVSLSLEDEEGEEEEEAINENMLGVNVEPHIEFVTVDELLEAEGNKTNDAEKSMQLKIKEFEQNIAKIQNAENDLAIAKYFFEAKIPKCTVSHSAFLNMIKVLRPGYTPPNEDALNKMFLKLDRRFTQSKN